MEEREKENSNKNAHVRKSKEQGEDTNYNYESDYQGYQTQGQSYPRQQNGTGAYQTQPTTVIYVVEQDGYQPQQHQPKPQHQQQTRYVQPQPQYVDQYGRPVQQQVVYIQEPPPQPILYDPDAVNVIWVSKFEDPQVRRDFIRRTYTILLGMLLFFFGFILLVAFHSPSKEYVKANLYAFVIPGFIIVFGVSYVFCCCIEVLFNSPTNLVFLFLVTIGYTLFMMGGAVAYKPEIIALAMGITLGLFLILTVFAFTCKFDFTKYAMVLCVVGLVVFLFVVLAAILVPLKYMSFANIAISAVFALIFCMWIVIDTQMLMDGKKYHLEPDMEVFAAIMLFINVVHLFMHLLEILGYLDS